MSIIATLLLMTAAVMAADRISIAPIMGTTTLTLAWDAMTNPIVAGFIINKNGVPYRIAGRTNASITFTNVVIPGNTEFTAQTYSSQGGVSIESEPVEFVAPVTLLKLSYPTNCIFQQTLGLNGSWISCGSTVTNNGGISLFRATSPWP